MGEDVFAGANTNAKVTLTDQLMDVIGYLADAEKKFVNTTVDGKIKDAFTNFTADLGKTKDELKELVKSLDGLDFKEDGKIDASVITAKVAELETSVKTIDDKIASINDQAGKVSDADLTAVKADIKTLQSDVTDIKTNIIAKLTTRVGNLENEYKDLEDRVSALEIDVKKIKAQIDKSYV